MITSRGNVPEVKLKLLDHILTFPFIYDKCLMEIPVKENTSNVDFMI